MGCPFSRENCHYDECHSQPIRHSEQYRCHKVNSYQPTHNLNNCTYNPPPKIITNQPSMIIAPIPQYPGNRSMQYPSAPPGYIPTQRLPPPPNYIPVPGIPSGYVQGIPPLSQQPPRPYPPFPYGPI